MAVSESNSQNILAKKIVKPSTSSNNKFVKILKGLITKIPFII